MEILVPNHYLQNIDNRLKKWSYERKLSLSHNRIGFEKNFNEEYLEYKEAKANNDIHGQIDALCDMYVFMINADYEIKLKEEYETMTYDEFMRCMHPCINIFEYMEPIENCKLTEPKKFQLFIRSLIESLGYNWYFCMIETIKEIESRTGEWNEIQRKWIKDTSPEAKAKWYKADYENCRLDKVSLCDVPLL